MAYSPSAPIARAVHRPILRRRCGLAVAAGAVAILGLSIGTASAQSRGRGPNRPNTHGKLDDELSRRSNRGSANRRSRLIVRLEDGKSFPPGLAQYIKGNRLGLINGYVLEMPDSALAQVNAQVNIHSAHFDRPVWAADYLSTHSTAADVAQHALGVTGAGIGVAVIDSGITSWHDDLTSTNHRAVYPFGNQRVSAFVDFVNGQNFPYDDHGHGSHVAGIILGNGFDSGGKQSGMAPGASLISLKVLDRDGKGTISTIIAALEWVAANAKAQNIRVVNLSAGAAVTESYWTDPLTLAGVVSALLMVGVLACFVPASRAAGTDAVSALRFE